MKTFEDFLVKIEEPQHKEKMAEVLSWVAKEFPELGSKIAWNQPMFTDHGTFIIGFSVTKKNINIAPEIVALNHLEKEIAASGYHTTKMLIQIPWESPVDYSLLKKIIEFNILDKAECTTFWRK